MLINKHIGSDSEDGDGIMGDQFTRELMFLDSLGKKSIDVWINSGGGVVTDGEQIVHAILASSTPVDTVCTGTAASIAAPIFMAGRNRSMMDFSKLMTHPVSGGDEKSTKAFEQSIRTMLSSRSFLTEDTIKIMMDRTTWIFPTEAEELGLCTKKIDSNGLNVNDIDIPTATYKDYTKIVNKLIENKTHPKMSKVTNKLGLNDSANEDAILNAIESIESKFKAEIAENKSKFDKYMDEMANAKKMKDESDTKYNELKAKFEAMEIEAENKAKEATCNEAEVEISNAVKLGKIENKEEIITKMKAQYIANPIGTKEILNAIPSKVTGAKFETKIGNASTYTVMDINNSMLEKLNKRK